MAYAAHAAQALRMLSEAAAGAESAAENSAQSQTEAAMSQQTSASSSEAASAPSPPAEAEPSWDTVTLKSFVFLDFKFWMNYATGAVRISVNLMVAIIMFLMFLMIVKLIVWAVKTVMSNPKQPVDPAVRPFVLLSLKALLWIQILPIVIGQIGINIDSMLAVISAVALAVGIALRPMVEKCAQLAPCALTSTHSRGAHARACTSMHEHARARTSTHEHARARTRAAATQGRISTHGHARVE